VVERRSFVAAARDGVVTFAGIEVVERSVRRYADTAILIGRTAMKGAFAEAPLALASRYTHVFVRDGEDRWRLVSA
jgi:ketosteroid isomerase-like protein